jgi:hypothetical protein
MSLIINAGSHQKGGTFEEAEKHAIEWLELLKNNGFYDIEMKFIEKRIDGNFHFEFKHKITGKIVNLETHGYTDEECKKFIFRPREYWNGSSTAGVEIKDWLSEGFNYKINYYKEIK